MESALPRVLCVDDEPNVLRGLGRHLMDDYELHTATSGAEGLAILASAGPFSVIVSDMRMPQMDGAAFLEKARTTAPGAVRMLLTGQTDLTSAAAAVNDGQIFRFLLKPCQPEKLQAAVKAACQQHDLQAAERILLEKTLHGSVKAMLDILALAQPEAFGRAQRIKQRVDELADRSGMQDRWMVDVAAMLSQLGCVALPPEVLEKLNSGQSLNNREQEMKNRAAMMSERILDNIPRLEEVRWMLSQSHSQVAKKGPSPTAELGAKLIRLASDLESLEAQGIEAVEAVETLRGRKQHDPRLLDQLAHILGEEEKVEIRELAIHEVQVGMVLAQDLKLKSGMLLAARGYQITQSFVERAENYSAGSIVEPVRVLVKRRQSQKNAPS
jgi:CheY-like chemotaxis protein